MNTLTYAPDAMRLLNGIFCIYKPAGLHSIGARSTLLVNLARDLNAMETRPTKNMVVFEGSVASGDPFVVKVKPNLADHVLVVGPRYQIQDFRIRAVSYLGRSMSGIMLMAVNNACGKSHDLPTYRYLQTIEAKCKFGFATDTFFEDGKVLEKSTFAHIRQETLDRFIASVQATHQSEAFKYSGVNLDSQEAYDLASKGIIRPKEKSPSLIYNITCTEFNPPDFTLKIQCCCGTQEFLAHLIHQLGIYLRSCAVCCSLRQTQLSHFNLDYALLKKHWTVEHILNNIALCKAIMNTETMKSPQPRFENMDNEKLITSVKEMQRDHLLDELTDETCKL